MKKLLISFSLSVIFVLGCIGSSDDSDSDTIDFSGIELDLGSSWEIASSKYNLQDNSGYIHLKYKIVVKEMNLSFIDVSDATSDIDTELAQKKSELNADGSFIEDGNATVYGHANAKYIIYNMSADEKQFYEYIIIWDCNVSQRHYMVDFKDYFTYSSVSLDISKNGFSNVLLDIKDH